MLKTLQEEHRLLQDMEAALEEIKNAPSTSGLTSLVRWVHACQGQQCLGAEVQGRGCFIRGVSQGGSDTQVRVYTSQGTSSRM